LFLATLRIFASLREITLNKAQVSRKDAKIRRDAKRSASTTQSVSPKFRRKTFATFHSITAAQ
jgi:hypothetical protein